MPGGRTFGVVGPIARQNPFDVTVLVTGACGPGSPVFVETQNDGIKNHLARALENGTFCQCVARSDSDHQKTPWEDILYAWMGRDPNAEFDSSRFNGIDVEAMLEPWTQFKLVGFAITDGEGIKCPRGAPEGTKRRHVPITIAGAMTMARWEFFRLCVLALLQAEDNVTVMSKWSRERTTDTFVIRAGTKFRIGCKVIRVQETVHIAKDRTMREMGRLAKSVTVIVSTLSS